MIGVSFRVKIVLRGEILKAAHDKEDAH